LKSLFIYRVVLLIVASPLLARLVYRKAVLGACKMIGFSSDWLFT